MSNSLYDSGRSLMLQAALDWAGGSFDIYLIDTTHYTVNTSAHSSMADVAGSAIVSGPVALTGKAVVAGAADANDPTFPLVTGATCQAMIIAKHTGTPSTDTLLAYIDSATGLPITPNGGNIIYVIDSGVNRLFKP